MHRRTTLTAALGAAASLALAVSSTAVPAAAHAPFPGPAPWTKVASGLDNPRLLSWGGDSLYVAEAGVGGDGACIPNPEDPEAESCLGLSGAITKVTLHHRRSSQRRVVTGLPSLATAPGNEAVGPGDVVVVGKRWFATVGLGGNTEVRASLGRDAKKLGTLLTGTLKHKRWGRHGWGGTRPRVVADLAAYEAANDPDGGGEDSNPTGLALVRGGLAVTDSGGNDALLVNGWNRVSTVATFPTRLVPPPPFLPQDQDIPMESVPTSAVQGPDGAWYVSELTGFPFPPGESTVWRVPAGGGTPTAYATGLTNVTDLTWHKGKLYVVQLVDVGLLNADPAAGMPEGSLRRVERDGSTTVVAEGLPTPYGVALRGRSAYVTTCSICADGGQVVKIRLR
ncbi:ScyD/ScyE family protein [Nocardioides daphniae]|uniref:ScyD/ScyE family protein n=1 Tax=Nocardioides daphniae TaxID=402297 RepID=UPI003613C56F